MVDQGLTRQDTPSWNPLRCDGTELPSGWLLAAKLLALTLFPRNRFLAAGPPFLPFLPLLDAALFARWLAPATAASFWAAFVGLMFNRHVKISCRAVGGCVFVHIAGHRLEYSNNGIFAGVFLLLLGMHDRRTGLLPLRIQLSLVYGGACVNKALDPDWWNGRYVDTLMIDALNIRWYTALARTLPPWSLGRLIGRAVIVTEAVLAVAVLAGRTGRTAVKLMLAFHLGLLGATLGRVSIPFTYASLAVSAAFLHAPAPAARMLSGGSRRRSADTPAVWWMAALGIRLFFNIRAKLLG